MSTGVRPVMYTCTICINTVIYLKYISSLVTTTTCLFILRRLVRACANSTLVYPLTFSTCVCVLFRLLPALSH